ncbi:hypothetical protein DFH06DRAFT_1296982 [Mycena polygramma]|nr:hypothetical protein DFH06DRAFT_1296982 [Mycena polygramma]
MSEVHRIRMSPSDAYEPGTRAQISDSERLVAPPNLFRPATTTSRRRLAVHRSSLPQFPQMPLFKSLHGARSPALTPQCPPDNMPPTVSPL